MKHKYIFVAALLSMLTIGSYIISVTGTHIEKEEDEILVVTSFYPVYIAALNVTDGVEGIKVECLTQSTTGCVHDIQLTTQDMRLLEQADVFLINGAGMESYLDSITERYPNLKIVDTSEGVQLLESSGEHHHEEETQNHEETTHTDETEAHDDHAHSHNSHIWMNMDNYCIQIENMENALAELDHFNKAKYAGNSDSYQQKVKALQSEAKALAGDGHMHVVSTHEAFSYFAENLGWHIEATINMDENTSLHAVEVSEVIDMVQNEGISYVFTEEIHGTKLSGVLKQETGCETIVLDTLVTGEEERDAYLKGMEKNLKTLKEVTGL